jgi:uncharacterized damage-inducible protein DinB
MPLEEMLLTWKEVRKGLIAELNQIPAEQFGFKAAPESRSVAGIVRHILVAQQFSTAEICRPDTDFSRIPFRELIAKDAIEGHSSGDKEALLESLESSIEGVEAMVRAFGAEPLGEKVPSPRGGLISKLGLLYLYIDHEMYHRGQISVYERLLQIEPAQTVELKAYLAKQGYQ